MAKWSGLPIGKTKSGRMVYFHGKVRRHCALVGGSGVGKSTLLATQLLGWNGSAIVFDPTGEHGAITSGERSRLGPCYKWDPLGIGHWTKARSVRINPIGPHWLFPGPRLYSRANDSAASIVPEVPGSNKFFWDSPRGMLGDLEVGLTLHAPIRDRNLPTIARLMRGPLERHMRELVRVTNNRELAANLRRFLADPDGRPKSIREFIETAITETSFLMDPSVAAVLSASDVTYGSFSHKVQTLYIHAPLECGRIWGPINKLHLGAMIAELFQSDRYGPVPVLIVCDELYQYGRDLEILPRAAAAARKFNCVLVPCVTSIGELKEMFPNSWESSILNNMGATIILDAYDNTGSEMVSKRLGEREFLTHTKSLNFSHQDFDITPVFGGQEAVVTKVPTADELKKLKVNLSYQSVKRPLLSSLEVRQLPLDQQIVWLRELERPMLLKKIPYYETEFAKKAGKNPFFRG